MKRTASAIFMAMLMTSVLCSAFKIVPVGASGTIYIRADGSIDPPTAPISTVDNITYILTGNITSDADGIVVERDNIIVDGAGYVIQGAVVYPYKGIRLSARGNVTIQNAQIKSFDFGICLDHDGLGGSYSSNCSISRNNVTNNRWGIYLDGANNNKISGNNITNNSYGVFFDYTNENNTVYGNNIANNELGICLDGYISTTYEECPENNKIYENNIEDNAEAGVKLVGLDNIFCHNNFLNNSIVIESEFSSGGTNDPKLSRSIFDDGYPSGGNYWSDYTGVDLYGGPNQDYPSGSDGMGDSPYTIDVNNQDRYPLMTPWVGRTLGVKAGDWAKYRYEFMWSSTDPNEQPPQDWVDIVANLEWYGIDVLEVFDTTVVFQTIIHLQNGTETESQWAVDINDGSGNGTYLIVFIAAGLNPGETLCTFPPQSTSCGWQVEETILRPYVGVSRETNYLNVTDWSFVGPYLPLEFDSVDDFYWDRTTGIINEQAHQQSFESDGYVTSLSYTMKIVDTNLWKNLLLGDCNGDGVVDISDLAMVGAAFGSEPGQPRWNEAADVRKDGVIDVFDLVTVAMHYGETNS